MCFHGAEGVRLENGREWRGQTLPILVACAYRAEPELEFVVGHRGLFGVCVVGAIDGRGQGFDWRRRRRWRRSSSLLLLSRPQARVGRHGEIGAGQKFFTAVSQACDMRMGGRDGIAVRCVDQNFQCIL